jgi:DNA-binding Lrp family transcriptional regulator
MPPRSFSDVDKNILKILLEPKGNIPSSELAQRLGIPRNTIERRRDYLEENYLSLAYFFDLRNVGYRRVDLLIYTGGGGAQPIARELLRRDNVVSVGRSIGEHTIDLRAEVIIKDNSELLGLLEEVKAMNGVKDVVWSEIVDIMGAKRSVPSAIIDKL